jgi:DNA-binding HxlR family transcriptional regulator
MSDVHPVCTRFHTAIELIGARWSGAVLRVLLAGASRFSDLKAAIPGISDTMLAHRLRELGDAGMVERRVLPTTPVRVEYHLTEMGRDIEPVLDALIVWSHAWIPLPPGTSDDDTSHPTEHEPVTAHAGAPNTHNQEHR